MLHYICITWKLIAALVPPPGLAGGLPAFAVSLLLLGATTYLIQEFAILLGCVLGLSDAVTAITYVALGTSLPDTFASRHACIADDDADGSLTNITGAPLAVLKCAEEVWQGALRTDTGCDVFLQGTQATQNTIAASCRRGV